MSVAEPRARSDDVTLVSIDGAQFDLKLRDIRRISRFQQICKRRMGDRGELVYCAPLDKNVITTLLDLYKNHRTLPKLYRWDALDRVLSTLNELGGFEEFEHLILDIFAKEICVENCISIWRKTRKFKDCVGEAKSLSFIVYNLCTGVLNRTICPDFFRLTPELLKNFLTHDKLNILDDERNVQRIISAWIQADPVNRELHREELNKCVRLGDQIKPRSTRDHLICISGCTAKQSAMRTIEVYDKTRDTWHLWKETMLPNKVLGTAIVAVGRSIFVTGGTRHFTDLPPVSDVLALEISETADGKVAPIWTEKASMNNRRSLHCACLLNNHIYVMGGLDVTQRNGNGPVAIRSVEKYDIATNKWTTLRPMVHARAEFAAASAGGRLFVCGGRSATGGILPSVEMYLPDANVWVEMLEMPTSRRAHSLLFDGHSLLVLGGFDAEDTAVPVVHKWKPDGYLWTEFSTLSVPRGHMATSVMNGKIFACGGLRMMPNRQTRTVKLAEMYDTEHGRWINIGKLARPRHGATLAILRNCTINTHQDDVTMSSSTEDCSGSSTNSDANKMHYMLNSLNQALPL